MIIAVERIDELGIADEAVPAARYTDGVGDVIEEEIVVFVDGANLINECRERDWR